MEFGESHDSGIPQSGLLVSNRSVVRSGVSQAASRNREFNSSAGTRPHCHATVTVANNEMPTVLSA